MPRRRSPRRNAPAAIVSCPIVKPMSSARSIGSAWRSASGCKRRCARIGSFSPTSRWLTVIPAPSTITSACCAWWPRTEAMFPPGSLCRSSSSSASSGRSTATSSTGPWPRSTAHPGTCLGFNISGLTATDYAWLRAIDHDAQGQARYRAMPGHRDHRDGGVARCGGIGALRRCAPRSWLPGRARRFRRRVHLLAPSPITGRRHGEDRRLLCPEPRTELRQPDVPAPPGRADRWFLGLKTIAECVETAREAAILRREGVGYMQGYYFGKPTVEQPWTLSRGAYPRRALAAS